jgi:hypothetical protein
MKNTKIALALAASGQAAMPGGANRQKSLPMMPAQASLPKSLRTVASARTNAPIAVYGVLVAGVHVLRARICRVCRVNASDRGVFR